MNNRREAISQKNKHSSKGSTAGSTRTGVPFGDIRPGLRNARLDESQAGIKIARRNINSLGDADGTILMAESEEELESLLMRVEEESENTGLKFNIQKTKIVASGPITTWQIDREKVEIVTDFIFLGFKITVDSDCSHEIKRCLLLRRKAVTNLDSILNSRKITLTTKLLCSQSQ